MLLFLLPHFLFVSVGIHRDLHVLTHSVPTRRSSHLAHIEASGGDIVARDAPRIPTIAGYRMPGLSARAQLIQFDLAGISVSAGSACSSGDRKSTRLNSSH